MKIQWFGNSTFLLTTDLGKKILLDPFNIFSTLTENITADISTFSMPIDFSIVKNIKPFGKIVNTACNCDIENIKVSGKIFRREDSLFINEIGLSSLAHFNNQEAFCETEKISFKLPEKELVLFKLDAEKGYFMQVNSLNVGDTFSILAYPSVLKQNLDEILCITGLTEEQFTKKLQKPEEITQDKLLVHNLTAKKPSDSFLTVKEKTVIKLAKGLKVNNEKNTYLCNAQPQIYLKSNVREVYLNNNPVSADDLNNRIKNPGIYQIRANNNNKKFVITANPTENEHKNLIFHTFSEKNSIEITNEASGQFCISGVHIYNDKEVNSEINAKISKLLFIINALKKKQTRKIPFSFVKKGVVMQSSKIFKFS